MGLNGLDSALSGLRVAQQSLSVISANVSNVNTPGYTRKILPQRTLTIEGKAVGAITDVIGRNVNFNTIRDFWTQVSRVSVLDTQAKYLNRVQEFHGPPNSEMSVAAEMADLRDVFSTLSDSPEDSFLQRQAVEQAITTTEKINDLSALIQQIRNDAQDEMALSVQSINDSLEQIAELNKQIRTSKIGGRTTAALEDARDVAIQDLSKELEITFFTRGDGVMVVQTSQGQQLADERAETLFFVKTPVSAQTYYPETVAGLYLGGDPDTTPTAVDLTDTDLGGRLGGLIELRDQIMPQQQAMLDEMAHKMALRFDIQGLRLFTDQDGNVPADTAPDPLTDPPTPVAYVGFAAQIRVNDRIIDDNSLIQSGTVDTDVPVQTGSNEVIRRILNFALGDVEYQIAEGDVDLRASAGPASLQTWLGLYSENTVKGTTNIGSYTDVTTLMAAGDSVFNPTGIPTDEFTITFEESRTAPPLGPITITVALSDAQANFPLGGGVDDALDQIIEEINSQITLAGVPAGLTAQATRNAYGQLVIESRGDITVAAGGAAGMGDEGLEFLGLSAGTFETTDPYFDVQIGNDAPVRITIEPGEDETDLIAKLNKTSAADAGVAGLAVSLDAGTGFLTLRPGDSLTDPSFGGDIRIIGGSFTTDGTGTIPGGVVAGTGLVAALFGSDAPVSNVLYSSPTSTGGSVAFRSTEVGAGANLNTGIISSANLVDFAQKMVNRHSEEINVIETRQKDEVSFRDLLQQNFTGESGVNLDEEMASLIVVQTAFAAAARVITAIDEQFQELLRSI